MIHTINYYNHNNSSEVIIIKGQNFSEALVKLWHTNGVII